EIEFKLNEAKEPQTELFSNEPDFDFVAPNVALPQVELPDPAVEAVPGASKIPIVLAAAAVLSGLAIVAVVAAVLFLRAEAACEPEAIILTPESGATISEATEIKVAAKNTKCIERVAFELDGEEIASVATAPYSVTLEPENFRQFADDETSHVLSLKIVNRDGIAKPQKDEILLAFSTEKIEPEDSVEEPDEETTTPLTAPSAENRQISFAETREMSERLIKQFSGNFAYKFDRQFLQQVQTKTKEYQSEGYSNRAAGFRDAINVAFVGEQGLDAPLGYLLAMSRSRFENKRNGASEGLWQMTADFAASNGYNGQCGAETLSDPTQNCAARAAAIYTKALVVNLFEGDIVYGVSCFGMPPAEAGNFKISLPADRADFWNTIKSPKQRDTVVRFFAAGIVAENPQKFGLKRDKPLSNLYRVLMNKPN
ncbi:MAG TPA: Ig-like domain-containing protein, partial [Pyrinomonadaceae bacterium]|nr:Ig-like domain-containing protein [Pyrinomonadaceae bacterium]